MARKNIENIECGCNDLEFQITDIYTPESDYNNKKKRKDLALRNDPKEPDKITGYLPQSEYTIIIYGSTANGNSVTLKVNGYQPYFYLKIPDDWTHNTFTELINKLKTVKTEKIKYYDDNDKMQKEFMTSVISEDYHSHLPPDFDIVLMKDFWGFKNEKKFEFYKIKVKSYTVFNNLKRYFGHEKRTKQGFKLYGSNLDPMLRFLHDRNLEPCNWIKIKANKYSVYDSNFSRTQHCFECSYTNIHSLESNKNAPLLVMATDIECTSSHGDFPLAKKDYKKLAVDLVTIARVQKITKENLSEWICLAFHEKQIINIKDSLIINRLYTKQKVSKSIVKISLTDDSLDKIISQLETINKIIGIGNDDSESDLEDESDKSSIPNITKNNEIAKCEKNITEILNLCFNKIYPLKGDPLIQIGSTFNIFGSDEIIYKNIISFGGCSECEGIDVIQCDAEKDVIMEWKQLIIDQDPDILAGYNTFGFDFKYIAERAEELEIYDEFIYGLGRLRDRKNKLETKLLASSALGENIMYLFSMDGVVSIDMLKVMQRDQKLDSFKLDNVAKTFLGDQKDDLKPKELFEKFLGSDDDRAVIAKYCIQDCALVNRLIHKLKVLENNIGMANVSCVPLNFIFMRGQGIKIFSLVSREAAKDGFIIPVIDKPDMTIEDDGYEGALVLDPQEGIYLDDPITVFDYNSLYPSSMIDRNLSHDTIVLEEDDEEYGHLDNDPNSDITYNIVTYDLYEGKGDKKKVIGQQVCKFAQYKDGRKGVIPKILMNVLAARKFTKALMEYETVIDKNSKEYSGIIEESVKDNIEILIIKDMKTKLNTEIPKDSIIERKQTYNKFELATLDSRQNAFKVTANSIYGQTGSRTSQICLKEIAACTTARGRDMIMKAKKHVEDEHQAEVIYGDSVMYYTPILLRNKITGEIITKMISDITNEILNHNSEDQIWQRYDVFKAGESNRREKQQIEITNYQTWTYNGWSDIKRVIKHKCNKSIYRILTHSGLVDVTEDHSLLSENKEIIKPTEVKIGSKLLYGFPDLHYNSLIISEYIVKFKRQIDAQIYFKYIYNIENLKLYDISLDYINNEYNIICTKKNNRNIINNAIKKIEKLYDSYNDYVYDLETEEGNFQAGIGNIIVKNTDSIFCKFPHYSDTGKRVYGKEALEIAIIKGQEIEKSIKKIMPLYQNLAYEKVLWPFILLSKKRYVGNLYEKDPNKKKLKSMGLAIKRRDYAPIVKIIYGGIIEILINQSNLSESIRFLRDSLQDLIDGKMSLENLIVSKTLKGSYKDPTKIAHKVLADRIGERDEGNKPMVNERVPYVYILLDPGIEVKLQGDRIESPDYIREHNLIPDYKFYITNQLKKPISQLYTLCVDQLPGYDFEPAYWLQIEEELKDKIIYQDPKKCKSRIQSLKMKVVEELLFKEYIDKLTPPKEPKKPKEKEKISKKKINIQEIEIPENSEINEVQEEPLKKKRVATKLNNNIIDIKYQCKKKTFTITIKIKMNSTIIWEHEIIEDIKGIKNNNSDKIYQLSKATEIVFNYISNDNTLKDIKFILKSDDYYISILKEGKILSDEDYKLKYDKNNKNIDLIESGNLNLSVSTRRIIELNTEHSYLINI
jgi:DNA polymerase elongation subunit (family B)